MKAAMFGVAMALMAAPALAQTPPGMASAVPDTSCNRDCLIGHVHAYMDALVHKDPSRAVFSPKVMFTENEVAMPIGEGLWGSVSKVLTEHMEAADPYTGAAAWFGIVEEYGAPAYYAMRIKVAGGQITEVETVVERKTGLPAPFGDPEKVVHDPAFNEVLPPEQRRSRERLMSIANSYFDTVEQNDGTVFAPFDEECGRLENGISTTAAPANGGGGSASIASGCEAQFKLGIYNINKRVRERRYLLIDEERGVVIAAGSFDHDNSYDNYKLTDGRPMKTALKWPNSITMLEGFRIKNGKIHRIEAVFTYVPYFMHNPFATPVRGAPNSVQPMGLGVR